LIPFRLFSRGCPRALISIFKALSDLTHFFLALSDLFDHLGRAPWPHPLIFFRAPWPHASQPIHQALRPLMLSILAKPLGLTSQLIHRSLWTHASQSFPGLAAPFSTYPQVLMDPRFSTILGPCGPLAFILTHPASDRLFSLHHSVPRPHTSSLLGKDQPFAFRTSGQPPPYQAHTAAPFYAFARPRHPFFIHRTFRPSFFLYTPNRGPFSLYPQRPHSFSE